MSNPNPVYQPSNIAQKHLYPGKRHYLYEADLEHNIAFCTTCGWTEIHVAKTRTKQTPKVFCINRFREKIEKAKDKRHSQAGWRPRHLLSEIDSGRMTATCSICGPTKIRRHAYQGSFRYTCATHERAYTRKYRRTHYTSKKVSPFVHVLSQIDEEKKTAVCSICGPVQIYIWQGKRKICRRCSNASVNHIPPAQEIRRDVNTNLVNSFKVDRGCKRCGYNADFLKLSLSNRSSNKKVPDIEKLLKLTSERLSQELENCEVLCVNCR